MLSVEEISKSLQSLFGWTDYIIFGLMLVICMAIGVYFSNEDREKRKKATVDGAEAVEYLLGGRTMTAFPVALSLLATCLSGSFLLGNSTEVYLYGYQYMFFFVAFIIAMLLFCYLMLPVLHDLQLTLIYEYYEMRFDRSVRIFGSLVWFISLIFRTPIQIYVPALALNQVAGIDIYIMTPILCFICIFYTCIGGLKAVVWTDAVQSFIIFGTLITVAVKTTIDLGGLGAVIELNLNSTRIETPIFDIDPTIRNTFWTVMIGGLIYNLGVNGADQGLGQRYLSVATLKTARQVVWIHIAGFFIVGILIGYNGFLLYAKYHECDPLSTGLAKRPDQLIPLLVMEVVGSYPFLTGCFIASVFSASLSTLSTGWNAMAGAVLEDYLKTMCGIQLSEKSSRYVLRSTVVIIGIATTAMVIIVDKLGPVLQLVITVAGTAYGLLLGIFILGMFMPWIGSRAALFGSVCGLIASGVIVVKSQWDIQAGILSFAEKPVSTDNCPYLFDNSSTLEPKIESDNSFYHLSYLYYSVVGVVVQILVSNLFCLVFRKHDSSLVDINLLSPPIRKYYKTKSIEDVKEPERADFTNIGFSHN